jgi:hypothetical protein
MSSDSISGSTSESRLAGAIKGVLPGLALFLSSFPLLWMAPT